MLVIKNKKVIQKLMEAGLVANVQSEDGQVDTDKVVSIASAAIKQGEQERMESITAMIAEAESKIRATEHGRKELMSSPVLRKWLFHVPETAADTHEFLLLADKIDGLLYKTESAMQILTALPNFLLEEDDVSAEAMKLYDKADTLYMNICSIWHWSDSKYDMLFDTEG